MSIPPSHTIASGDDTTPDFRALSAAMMSNLVPATRGAPPTAARSAVAVVAGEILLSDLLWQLRASGEMPTRDEWLRTLAPDGLVALIHVMCAALAGQQDALMLGLRLTALTVEPGESSRGKAARRLRGPLTRLLADAIEVVTTQGSALRAPR